METTPEHDDLAQQLQLRNRVLDASFALGRAAANELHFEPLCDQVAAHLADAFQTEELSLLFLDEDAGELYVKRTVTRGEAPRPGGARAADGPSITAMREQRVVCVADTVAPPASVVAVPLQPPAPSAAVPLIAESRVKGVLELSWPPGAARPTAEDLHLLRILATQVSSAIDNAWLYGELRRLNAALEEKVRARTADLSRALDELKHTQAQLVQREKMASLGQLTAGIAHEINNPIAYCISNVALAREQLGAVELRAPLLAALVDAAGAPPTDALALATAAIDRLAAHPRYRDDVRAVRADLDDAGAVAPRAALARRFLEYVRASEERDAPTATVAAHLAELLDSTGRGLERVKQIVLDLRAFSRLDEAQLQTVDLDDTVAGSVSIVAHLAKDRAIRLEHRRGMAAPYTCFPAKLGQVVLNLVTNALQATPAGKRVTVSTSETDDGPVIEVADEGAGIPDDVLPRIFDPFFTTKPVGQGTGLGLSISYGIVKEHGGRIDVDSRPGAGATFRIHLPARKGAASPTSPTSPMRRTHE